MLADGCADDRVGIDEDDMEVAGQARCAKLFRHLGRHFDSGKARAHDHDRVACSRRMALDKRSQMGIEPECRRISVHVKAVGGEAWNGRAHELAAKRQHEPIVGETFVPARRCDDHLLFPGIDGANFCDPLIDADRVEQFGERNGRVAQIDLVIANADVVIGVAIDDDDLDIGGAGADLVTLACGPDGGPQAGESRSEDDNARHACFSALPTKEIWLQPTRKGTARCLSPCCQNAVYPPSITKQSAVW